MTAITRLTRKELLVIDKLAEAWNLFIELEVIHAADKPEFAFAVHLAENIVLARPAWRSMGSTEVGDDG